MSTIKISIREITTGEAYGFSASVAGRDWRGRYTDENRAAHGNIVVRETHRSTGYWRKVNLNQRFREEGPWMQTIDHSAKISSLKTQLKQIETSIGEALHRAKNDGLSMPSLNAKQCRHLATEGPILASGGPNGYWRKYDYLAAAADAMEDHERIEAEIAKLKKEQGDFPVAAEIE